MENIKIPVWLVAICAFVFIGVILEQLYFSKASIDIWGLKLTQSNLVTFSESFPKGAILISAKPCSEVDGMWVNYNGGSGRFIIGVGATTDTSGTTKKFQLNQTGGEFSHLLSESEMPNHTHVFTGSAIVTVLKI